ncbi:MAG: OsmC family protein [Sphingomonadales bacterium]|nr:OsmC family protein [Sphingomonadales bacterium]
MSGFETIYLGDLRTQNVHLQSGNSIITDAPTDNQGKGEAFSPTDLCALSLANCIITTMGIYAKNQSYHIEGTKAHTVKHMENDPRRIARIEIHIQIHLLEKSGEHAKEGLLRIVKTCPVARSLHPDIIQDVTVEFI